MSPVAVVAVMLGVLFIVVGYKGKQDNLITGITGKAYGKTTLS